MIRLASFLHEGRPGYGPVVGDGVFDLAAHEEFPATLKQFVSAGPESLAALSQRLERMEDRIALDAIRWRLPIPDPNRILCLGLNYRDHADEGEFDVSEHATVFSRYPSSLVGHGENLVCPAVSHRFDFEAELAVILGRRAKALTPENALSAVWGYSLFQDGSIRDFQVRSTQWMLGKNFDATGSFGPWLVPADELPAGASGLAITTRLNGETVQSDNTANMIVDVASALCQISECMTLEAGDVIAMGTPAGCGFARQPRLWMKPGDRLEIEIEQIGTLVNPVIAEN